MESQLVKLKDGMDKAGKGYKVLTTILAVCSSVVMPVIELVIIFLPEILSIITKGKIEEKIKSGIESEMIPQIKAKLQEVIPSIIEEQMRSMVESTVHEFEIRIEEKKAALESMEGGELDDKNKKLLLDDIKVDIAALRETALLCIYGGAA